MAGYSGSPLPQKLGIKEGHRLAFLGAPPELPRALGALPMGAEVATALGRGRAFDVILLFVTEQAELVKRFGPAAKRLDPAGGLWIAWPKRASGVKTDVNENTVRKVALDEGLVDNKVCAIDEVWSGLRFVDRRADR